MLSLDRISRKGEASSASGSAGFRRRLCSPFCHLRGACNTRAEQATRTQPHARAACFFTLKPLLSDDRMTPAHHGYTLLHVRDAGERAPAGILPLAVLC